ncbi:hypothetical protein NCS52_01575800 [Fusarium sp. LHS14.1]|nr:hypothetical protein NCS52_01575800 [Fusarium sp. LHS14.1]
MQRCTQGRLSLFGLIFLLFAATLFTFAHAAPQAEPSSEPNDVVVEDGDDLTSGVDEGIPTETAAIVVVNEEDGTTEELPGDGAGEILPDESGKANTTEITQNIIVEETKKEPLDEKEKKEIEAEIKYAAALFEEDAPEKRDLVNLDSLEERDADDLEERDGLDARSRKDRRRRRRCRLLARVLRGFVQWAARLFRLKNPGNGVRAQHTHMFFLYPLHRPLFDANIHPRVWFKANWVAKRFWKGTAGVTFGKRVYVRAKYAPFSRWSSAASQEVFFAQTRLLAHEYQHVRQYQAHRWSIWDFAYEYIYKWCRAGKKYSKNPMEVAAAKAADKLLPLLKTERRFFRFWYRDQLRNDLGYPVETSYQDTGKYRRQLKFQKGAMQLDTKKSCYRKRTTGGWGSWNCRKP